MFGRRLFDSFSSDRQMATHGELKPFVELAPKVSAKVSLKSPTRSKTHRMVEPLAVEKRRCQTDCCSAKLWLGAQLPSRFPSQCAQRNGCFRLGFLRLSLLFWLLGFRFFCAFLQGPFLAFKWNSRVRWTPKFLGPMRMRRLCLLGAELEVRQAKHLGLPGWQRSFGFAPGPKPPPPH